MHFVNVKGGRLGRNCANGDPAPRTAVLTAKAWSANVASNWSHRIQDESVDPHRPSILFGISLDSFWAAKFLISSFRAVDLELLTSTSTGPEARAISIAKQHADRKEYGYSTPWLWATWPGPIPTTTRAVR